MQSMHSLRGSREVQMMQTHAQCTLSLHNSRPAALAHMIR